MINRSGTVLAIIWLLLGFGPALAQGPPPNIRLAGISQAELSELQAAVRRAAGAEQVSEIALTRVAERLGAAYQSSGRPNVDLILERIDRQAEALRTLQDRLAGYSRADDPAIASLLSQARSAIDAGDLDRADQLLAQAADSDLHAITTVESARRARAASTIAERGQLASLQARYSEAAVLYAQAATTLPAGNEGERIGYRLNEAEELLKAAEDLGDVVALRQAIRAYRSLGDTIPRRALMSEWLNAQIGLAEGLMLLGTSHEVGNPRLLQEALDVARSSLRASSRSSYPKQWAYLQITLGSILIVVGGNRRDADMIEEGINATRTALQERLHLDAQTVALVPYNIGEAYYRIGLINRSRDQARAAQALRQAINQYEMNLQASESDLYAWSRLAIGRAKSSYLLATIENDSAIMRAAIGHTTTIIERLPDGRQLPERLVSHFYRGLSYVWLAENSGANERMALARHALLDAEALDELARQLGSAEHRQLARAIQTRARSVR